MSKEQEGGGREFLYLNPSITMGALFFYIVYSVLHQIQHNTYILIWITVLIVYSNNMLESEITS